jgi:hypothetical protein
VTPDDIIKKALRKLGVIAAGETPDAAELSDGFDTLKDLLDSMLADHLTLYQNQNTVFNLVSGTQDYLVGPGQAVNIPPPAYVDTVNFINTIATLPFEMPLDELTDDAWAGITIKTLQAPYPRAWYYNATIPYATLAFWPIPNLSTLQGSVYSGVPLTQFTSQVQTLILPKAYARMLVTNLAMELAPEYGSAVSANIQLLGMQASESMAAVKRLNVEMRDLSIDPGALQGNGQSNWSIYSGP